MLGIIADLLSAFITILFPVFASYKALKASDPAQLAPWCIYWVVLSLFLLAESWTVFILGWMPFYSWIRLLLLSYLVLPQTQGAKLLYFNYISPFIERHEHDIEVFISDAHERAAAAGLSSVKKLVNLVREKILGLPPAQAEQAPPPQPQGYGASYAASLLARFSIPSARVPAAPSTADIYSLLSSAISSTTTSRPPTSASPSPDQSTAEKLTFLATQRERLTQLLSAVDREQYSLATEKSVEADVDSRMRQIDPGSAENVSDRLGQRNRNKSEHSFEKIDRDDLPIDGDNRRVPFGEEGKNTHRHSGNWIPSSWWGGTAADGGNTGSQQQQQQPPPPPPPPQQTQQYGHEHAQGRSTGLDTGK